MNEHNDSLVTRYLADVERAAGALSPARRHELLGDLREHIDTARTELPDETEDAVRAILHRLGPPGAIVAAAGPEEAGSPDPKRRRRAVTLTVVIGAGVLVLLLALAMLFLVTDDGVTPAPRSLVTQPAAR